MFHRSLGNGCAVSVRLPALKGNAPCRFAQRGPCPSGRCERAAKGYGSGRPGAPCEEYGVFRVKEQGVSAPGVRAVGAKLGGTADKLFVPAFCKDVFLCFQYFIIQNCSKKLHIEKEVFL